MKKLAAGMALLMCLGAAPATEADFFPGRGLAEAAEGKIQDRDFGYKGLQLGDDASKMRDILGEPLYEKLQTVQGVPLTIYEYPEVKVGIARATGKVVELALSGKGYALRSNVRYGATSYYLQKIYGKAERQWREGVPYFIYSRPGRAHEHLLLQLQVGEWYLEAARITALPLDDEEADRMAIEGADVDEGLEEAALEVKMGEKSIDTSALPQEEAPRLRMGGKA